MEGIVPQEVQWRKDKSNQSANFRKGLWKFEMERLSWLRDNAASLDGFADPGQIVLAIDQSAADPMGEDAPNLIWPAINLATWLKGLEARYRNAFSESRSEEQNVSIIG